MKIRGVKKLAAIAAGAALIGTALAPIATAAVNLTKGDVYDLTTGSPNVNIVVGSKAAITDAQWAGNIAAAIAKKATTTGTVDTTAVSGTWGTPSELAAKLVVGGTTVTYSGAKTIKADLNSAGYDYAASGTTSGGPNSGSITPFDGTLAAGSPPAQTTYTNAQLTNLINKSYSEKVNSVTTSLTIKEEVILDADTSPKFEKQAAIGDLILEIPTGSYSLTTGLIYRVDLGAGLSTIDTNYTDDGSADDVKLPWMGRDFTVRTISASQVELIQQQSEKTYTVGTGDNVITGLKGKGSQAGKELTLEFVQAATDSTVQAQVKDDNGTAIGNPQWLSAGDAAQDIMSDSAGNAVLDTGVYINTGGIKNVGSTTDPDYRVTALVGTDRVLLVDGKGYPYDSAATAYPWRVHLGFSTSNDLTSIEVYNYGITKIGTSALKPGDKLDLTDDKIATLEFKGLETDEVVSTMTLGKTVASDDSKFYDPSIGPVLTFTDNDSVLHKVPFYFKTVKGGCSAVKVDGKTFAIQTVYSSSSADMNFIVANGDKVNGYAWNFTDLVAGSNGPSADDYNIANTNFKSAGTNADKNTVVEGQTFDVNGVTYTLQDVNAFKAGSSATTIVVSPTGGGYITLVDNTSTCFDRGSYLLNTSSYVPGGSGFIFGGPGSDASGNTRNYPNSADQPDTPTSVDSNTEGVYFYNDQKMQDPSRTTVTSPAIRFPGSEGELASGVTYFTFVPYVDESKSYVYFLLTGQVQEGTSAVYHNKGLRFDGTDLDDGSFGSLDVNYYLPDITDFESHPLRSSASTSSDFNYFTAVFTFDDDEDYDGDINAYVDTATGKLVVYNAQRTNPQVEAEYRESNLGSTTWQLRDDIPASYIGWGYTDFGTKVDIEADELSLVMPENRPQVYAVITGASTTTEITGGEEITVTEGEQGTTATGTKVTVSDITFTDGTCTGGTGGEGETETYTTVAADNGKPQILLDDSTPQNAVLVGGHFVNRLSAQVSAVADTLKASGDKMEVKPYTGPSGENWIIVAGYTASDTVSAANELIDWLENLA